MRHLLEHVDGIRQAVSPSIELTKRSKLGQFMTPASIARFMASLFPSSTVTRCRLLDAGAGVGALTCAFLERCGEGDFEFEEVAVRAYEVDPTLRSHLDEALSSYASWLNMTSEVVDRDFIEAGVAEALRGNAIFTHAILNPPYKKINTGSQHRLDLRRAGIETVNLYTAFVALAVDMLAPGGVIVAIIPRSFCNGPYYRPFREFVTKRAAIRRMHLFASRSKAFKEDDVLQESIIVVLERGSQQGDVTVSTSTDETFSDTVVTEHPFDRIVFPNDSERFIHVPTSGERGTLEMSAEVRHTLIDIGVGVSTGPVVDFRLREHIQAIPGAGTVPLLYPQHFSSAGTEWPKVNGKKANAIALNDVTRKWLYPNGHYCVVRRFSSKEERHRIVASVVDEATFGGAPMLGFENHLNVFHERKGGMSPEMAAGLTTFLNTTAVDEAFRRFNGHTQVNATDLKQMRYPSRATLLGLGAWALKSEDLSQESIDSKFRGVTG